MKLSDYIDSPLCWVLQDAEGCEPLLRLLAERIAAEVDTLDADHLFDALVAREQLGSTGTPEGIAMPHAMVAGLDRSFVAPALVCNGVDFRSTSASSADLIFVLVGPQDRAWEHVRLLARVARICHRPGALSYLRTADSGEQLYERLVEEDARHV
jgi:PTS system nitrogen regulatory IIA component